MHMANTITFRPNKANRQDIQLIREAYSFPGKELTVTDAIRVALCATRRQLDKEGAPSKHQRLIDLLRPEAASG